MRAIVCIRSYDPAKRPLFRAEIPAAKRRLTVDGADAERRSEDRRRRVGLQLRTDRYKNPLLKSETRSRKRAQDPRKRALARSEVRLITNLSSQWL